MAACPNCGRGDLKQELLRTIQCLSCGTITDLQGKVIDTQDKGPNLSNGGLPVTELSETAPVVLATVQPEEEAPEVEPEVVAEPEESPVAPEEAQPEPLPVDLSSLSDEQKQALREALA